MAPRKDGPYLNSHAARTHTSAFTLGGPVPQAPSACSCCPSRLPHCRSVHISAFSDMSNCQFCDRVVIEARKPPRSVVVSSRRSANPPVLRSYRHERPWFCLFCGPVVVLRRYSTTERRPGRKTWNRPCWCGPKRDAGNIGRKRVGSSADCRPAFLYYDKRVSEETEASSVTERQIQAWADEAEAGYDVGVLKKRGRGRPGRGAAPSQVVAIRFTPEELAVIDERAREQNVSRSELIRGSVLA